MPLYEYKCKVCGHQFDVLRSMKDADKPIECRACHSDQTTRALSVFFASTDGRAISSGTSGCSGCGGGHCSTCGNN